MRETHSDVRYAFLVLCLRLIQMRAMIPFYAWQDTFRCVRLFQMCDMPFYKKAYRTSERVSHIWMCLVTHRKESWHASEWAANTRLKRHIAHLNESHASEWVLSLVLCLRAMGWLRLVGSLKLQVSLAKEPYKRDDILQKRPIISRSLLIVAIPYEELRLFLAMKRCSYCSESDSFNTLIGLFWHFARQGRGQVRYIAQRVWHDSLLRVILRIPTSVVTHSMTHMRVHRWIRYVS